MSPGRSGALFDFGAFLVMENFNSEREARHFDTKKVLISSGLENQIQPVPEHRIPFNLWGFSQSGIADPQHDNIWYWSHDLANALSDGRADRAAADHHLRNMLHPIADRLQLSITPPQLLPQSGCEKLMSELLRAL